MPSTGSSSALIPVATAAAVTAVAAQHGVVGYGTVRVLRRHLLSFLLGVATSLLGFYLRNAGGRQGGSSASPDVPPGVHRAALVLREYAARVRQSRDASATSATEPQGAVPDEVACASSTAPLSMTSSFEIIKLEEVDGGDRDFTASDASDSDSDEETAYETEGSEDEELTRIEEMRIKMVFVVRRDLPSFSKHQVVLAVASAGLGLVQSIGQSDNETWKSWHAGWNRVGVGKITLSCPGARTFNHVFSQLLERGLPYFVADVGAPPGPPAGPAGGHDDHHGAASGGSEEMGVLAIGPAPAKELDPITGVLKLLS